MSRIDDLLESFRRTVSLPWQQSLAPPQRVWMAVYAPDDERRLRLYIDAFRDECVNAGHPWKCIDITDAFEQWMAKHEYADAYFAQPDLMDIALPDFMASLAAQVTAEVKSVDDPAAVVAIMGTAGLFGLGEHIKVSALISEVQAAVSGRLLVFFPGEYDNNTYRLLGARDGWNYLATPITA